METQLEAHSLISFLVCCLGVTFEQRLRAVAPGLTRRQALAQPAGVHILDVLMPTTQGRGVGLSRQMQPDAVQVVLRRW